MPLRSGCVVLVCLLKSLQCNKNLNPGTFKNFLQFFSIICILLILLQTARDMPLLKYFKKSEKASALDPCNVCESMKNDLPNDITANKLEKVEESLKVAREGKKNRTVYAEKDNQEIAKYAAICGVTAAIRKFQPKFPNLTKSTVLPWVKCYKRSIKEQKKKRKTSVQSTIGRVRGDHCL